jgi:hypothetical protein
MFVNVSALVIAGVVFIAAIGHVWLFAELTSSPSGSPTEDPHS